MNLSTPLADTATVERAIGARAHRLYALTPDEIKLLEDGAAR